MIIVRFKFGDNQKENDILEETLNFNESCYIELEKKHFIKTKMKVQGIINESSIFDNEVYNP